jgi:peptide/nickel transport system substrate-binding protein
VTRDGKQLLEREVTRRDVLRGAGIGAFVLLTPAALAACGRQDDDNPQGDSEGSPARRASDAEIPLVTWAMGTGLRSLDLAKSFGGGEYGNLANCMEGLLRLSPEGELEPWLAESWDQPDPTTYVYTIREGVTFWNGDPLTVEDVEFTLNRHIDPKVASLAAAALVNVASIEATGPNELTIKLKTPDPVFQYVAGTPVTLITQKRYVETHGEDYGTAKAPGMGSGPMELTSFKGDSGLEMERYDGYWGEDKPRVVRFRQRFMPDPAARLLAMRSGEIDGSWDIPAQQLRQWRDAANVPVVPDYLVESFAFNVTKDPWSDIHVRRAFSHCCDKEGLTKALVGEGGTPAQTLVSPDLWAQLMSEDEIQAMYASLPQYEFDMDKARAELAQSSKPNGFKATLQAPGSWAEMVRAALNVAQNLEQIGIDLTVKEVSEEEWVASLYGEDPDGLNIVIGLTAQTPDPVEGLDGSYNSQQAVPGGQNRALFSDKRVDELLAQQKVEVDEAARLEQLTELLRITAEQVPYVPVFFAGLPIAVNRELVYAPTTRYSFYSPWISEIRAAA